jgi:hypothetical protein
MILGNVIHNLREFCNILFLRDNKNKTKKRTGFVDGNAFAYFGRNQSTANLNEVEIYFN